MSADHAHQGKATGKRTFRCAVYTRKSSEEGLEQDFNSLDAQREACEAYIQSQRHEGWQLKTTRYDDGGFSGGTLERPALNQLLEDIRSGGIDVVVVYKVDRLTRALSDFVRLVEIFDAQSVSFVSVTQQFNTTTSIGRLTLNVLLSFAQFEREVTGERIRDKIAASKRKGLWMGGVVPLGYDVDDRKLVPNSKEAEIVRRLYKLYLRHKNVKAVAAAAREEGLKSKSGRHFSRGQLYHLLQNPLYVGEVSYKQERHPGVHDAIVDRATWNSAQAQLARNRVTRAEGSRAKEPSLLTGRLFNEAGRRLTPSHAVKKGRRYRYYVEQIKDSASETPHEPQRIAAGEVERVVEKAVEDLLRRPHDLVKAAGIREPTAADLKQIQARASETLKHLITGRSRRSVIRALVERVMLTAATVDIKLDRRILSQTLGLAEPEGQGGDALKVPARLRRKGYELKLVMESQDAPTNPGPDPVLIKALVRGQDWWQRWTSGEVGSLSQLARSEGMQLRYLRRVMRLAFLAPDIKTAILDGTQPVELTAEQLIKLEAFPADWDDQRRLFGFTAP